MFTESEPIEHEPIEDTRYELKEAQEEGARSRERVESGLVEDYNSADFLANLEKETGVEIREITHEELREIVSPPGTITHVVDTRNREGELSFWFDLIKGKKPEWKSFYGESGTSVNVTAADGYNPSIESEDTFYTAKRSGEKYQNALVVFSSAMGKLVSGVDYINDPEEFYSRLLGAKVADKHHFLQAHLQAQSIRYQQPLEGAGGSTWPSEQVDFAAYIYKQYMPRVAHRQTEVHPSVSTISKRIFTDLDERIKERMHGRGAHFGYRLRGIRAIDGKPTWSDLPILDEHDGNGNISAIAIPITEGEKYTFIKLRELPFESQSALDNP